MTSNALTEIIQKLLASVTLEDKTQLRRVGAQIRSWIVDEAVLPQDLVAEISSAYDALNKRYSASSNASSDVDVAVRSSATAEDMPDASFAGQQDTFLNIRGLEQLLASLKHTYASLFNDRAISYRLDKGYIHADVALSIGVQKMVRSDRAASGVAFTLDTESGFRDVCFITSSYGLGENVVQGTVNPDEFYVHKPTLEQGFKPLLKKRLGSKAKTMVYAQTAGFGGNAAAASLPPVTTLQTDTPVELQMRYSLNDEEILELARMSVEIEKHYGRPMDIEWARDGQDGLLYIVQARPETVKSHNAQNHNVLETYRVKAIPVGCRVIARGKSVGSKIAVGRARCFATIADIQHGDMQPGDILVTDITDPDAEPFMARAAAIVTQRGGRTCHAAIIARELGVPAVVGTGQDTLQRIKDGSIISVDCSSGDVGLIYEGRLDFEVDRRDLRSLRMPQRCDLMLNIGNPDSAFSYAMLPHRGVGLARLEFIINNGCKIHPMALVHPDGITDPADRAAMMQLLRAEGEKYAKRPAEFFVDKLAQEAGTIAAAFYPQPVIVRMSDFKTNEYASLLCGKYFEPHEENPMIGWRGASRYYHEKYREAFALECRAMRKVREEMGLKNVRIMLPFVRTVREAQCCVDVMAENGLVRGENGLELYMMVEIPSNAILIDEFAKLMDGFSIGSNDLTQLTLGLDRDSDLVSDLFDERNEAVKRMISMAIEGAKRHGRKIGLCGQGPSDHPDFAVFLHEQGIDSMSLNPDSVIGVMLLLQEVEAKQQQKQKAGAGQPAAAVRTAQRFSGAAGDRADSMA